MRILVTGGAGLIGYHAAMYYKNRGYDVVVLDNLERCELLGHKVSSKRQYFNLDALRAADIHWINADISNPKVFDWLDVRDRFDYILHFAGQCGVPTSIENPRRDMEVNYIGTFNVLEFARRTGAAVAFASTNKVYPIHDVFVKNENKERWEFANRTWSLTGFPVTNDLDGSRTPYGASKYAADVLCQEYAHTYGVRTGVFRMSCLAEWQLVSTYFGTKMISDIRPEDLVWTGKNWTKVINCWNNGKKYIFELTTKNGYKLNLTADHRVKVVNGFRQLKDLMHGDLVEVSPQTSLPAPYNEKECHKAELLGYLFGDGTLYKVKNKPNSYIISFYGSKTALINIKNTLNILGIDPGNIVSSYSNSDVATGTSYKLHFSNSLFGQELITMGMPIGDKTSQAIDVPTYIKDGSVFLKRAFLRGYFGAECCAPSHKDTCITFSHSKDINITSDKFISSVRDILYKDFHIETSVTVKPPKVWKTRTTVQTNVRIVGGVKGRTAFNNIGFAFEEKRNKILLTRLRLLEYDDRIFDSIDSIEYKAHGYVYDLEVEDTSHVFTAGNIIVHNCIYGPNQVLSFSEQGWASWFSLATLKSWPLTVYGDGDQVRDMLYVEDCVRAYDYFLRSKIKHGVWNLGGGVQNTTTLNQHLRLMERITGKRSAVSFEDWRPSDQKCYVSDILPIKKDLGWEPLVNPEEGLIKVTEFFKNNLDLFEE